MNILTFTTLWPNAELPNFGIFVKHRVGALASLDGMNVRVVAPVPYFPKTGRWLSHVLPEKWAQIARLPERELIGGLQTVHPRYLLTPKLGMNFYGGWMASGTWETVKRLHAERPIDLIDAHYVYPDGHAATIIGQRLNVPVFITARGTDINLFSRMPLIRPEIINALNRAAGIIAVSESLKTRMVELGIRGEKIAVVRNGIDRRMFSPRDRNESRRRLGLDPDDRILLTVAALVPVKGIDRLIDAMVVLTKGEEHKRYLKLFVIGEGPQRRALESQISNLNLRTCVRLVGAKPQSELADWYSAADLFCLASHHEGCPNVVIESLACGLPVLAIDVGGIRELLTRNTGKVIQFGRVKNFTEEVERALAAEWERGLITNSTAVRSWQVVATEVAGLFRAGRFF
ncbi:MAG: glycosyltransferase family 4 protein [Acidobacteria bacterium]|nr:glycosyltransferase family 4 protein [Acidobacteriota bacterium]